MTELFLVEQNSLALQIDEKVLNTEAVVSVLWLRRRRPELNSVETVITDHNVLKRHAREPATTISYAPCSEDTVI